jgi:hypothetical protein
MSETFTSPNITDGDLEQMSDADLAVLEDDLLLEQELDTSKQARFSAGRAVVWVLMIIGIVLCMSLMSRLPTSKLGALNLPLYLIALFGGAALGHYAWKAAGRTFRNGVRILVANWPVVFYVVAQLYAISR